VELPDGNNTQFPDINKRDKEEKERQEKTTPGKKSENDFESEEKRKISRKSL
jgi:hypothetical protein